MTAERDILISLLKLTLSGPMSRASILKSTRAADEIVERSLAKFEQLSLFNEYKGVIEVSPGQRVRMMTRALELGAALEHVCQFLSWAEFEMMAAQALEANGYRVMNNFRFRHHEERREIDVLGLREPLIICADCKHWKRALRSSAALKIVEAQVERTRALADAFPRYIHKIGLEGWRVAAFLPVIISLQPGQHRFTKKVPIVPILQLQDFINELPLKLDLLHQIERKIGSHYGDIDKFL